jgi:hypothetical protein
VLEESAAMGVDVSRAVRRVTKAEIARSIDEQLSK